MSKNQKAPPSPRATATATTGDAALLFVDAIENGHARLLLGEEAFDVPARLLPRGTREGSWLRWSLAPAAAPPDEAAAIRAKLGRDDDGGDIEL